jgi:hypothetical protein
MLNTVENRVINNIDFLKQLSTSKLNLRQELVGKATNDQLFTLIECCFNILRARVPLDTLQKRKLLRHVKIIRKLARTRSPRSARQLLTGAKNGQTGRGVLLAAALISSIILPFIHQHIYKS